MFTITLIRRHAQKIGMNKPFCTRDVLHHGHRAAVDQALSRLVKCGFLRRLTRGVFVREAHFQCTLVYDFQILAQKAQAFSREMAPYLAELPARQKDRDKLFKTNDFAVDGRTTSLLIGDKRYDLKQVSKRRMALMSDESGRLLAGFWKSGKANVTYTMVNEAIRKFSREERQSLHLKIRYMPAWLSDLLVTASRRWQHRPI